MKGSNLPVSLLVVYAAATAVRGEVEGPLRDDPRGRQAARSVEEGLRTPEDRLNIREIARAEARRLGLSARAAATRAAGVAWGTLGPRTASVERPGVTCSKDGAG